MLITKRNLAVLEAATKEQDGYFALNHVMLDPVNKTMAATNGASLYETVLDGPINADYPDVGPAGAVSSAECLLVPASALLKAEKNLPKKTVSILTENIQVLIDDTYKYLVTSNLDITNIVKVKHAEGVQWPDVRMIKASVVDREAVSVQFRLSELEVLVKVMKKNGSKLCDLSVYDRKSPVKVKMEGLTGFIMPWIKP